MMRMMRLATIATGLLATCTPAQNGGGEDSGSVPGSLVSADSHVTMQRQPCFGFCPVYIVDITGDGLVTFRGEQHVDTVGTATRNIAPESVSTLMREIVDAGFFEFDEQYTMDAKGCGAYHTDAPTVTTTVRLDGRVRTVEHDYGCQGAPEALRQLHERIDSVAGVARWVGTR